VIDIEACPETIRGVRPLHVVRRDVKPDNLVLLPKPTGMSEHCAGLIKDFTELAAREDIVATAMVALPRNGGPILGFTKNDPHAYRFLGAVELLRKRVADWVDD
jgi:hypothetical protein